MRQSHVGAGSRKVFKGHRIFSFAKDPPEEPRELKEMGDILATSLGGAVGSPTSLLR